MTASPVSPKTFPDPKDPADKADLTGGDEVNTVSSGCVIFDGDASLVSKSQCGD